MQPDPFVSSAQRSPWPRRLAISTMVLVPALVLVAIGFGVLAWHSHGRLPGNTLVAGVEVGGMSRQEASRRVRVVARSRLDDPVLLVAPGTQVEVSGALLRATPQIDAALSAADDVGLFDRISRRFGVGETRRIPLRYRSDPDRVEALYRQLAERFEREPRSAKVVVTGTSVRVVPAFVGTTVDELAFVRGLKRLPETFDVPLVDVEPDVTTAAATRAMQRADRLLSERRTISFRSREAVLGAKALRDALRFEPTGQGGIAMTLDTEALLSVLGRVLRRVEIEPVDASFAVDGARVRVVPSRPGRELDVDALVGSLTRNLSSTVHRARFVVAQPGLSTPMAEKLRVRELVSEFTTYYSCCQPRVSNIQRAAQLLDGTLIEPGRTFSMNEALGQRTEENGFVSAPQIFRGRLEDAIGGGISQVATTLYNAAFFAGIKLVEHQAHQFYISRYPMGREATVSWGGPELIFRNDWPAAILIKVDASDTAIHVRFYSSKLGRRVVTVTGEPYAYRAPTTVTTSNPSLPPGTTSVVQSAGTSGFTVQYTRKVFKGPKLLKDERYTVRYDPQNAFVEVGPPRPPEKPKAKQGSTGERGSGENPGAAPAPAGKATPVVPGGSSGQAGVESAAQGAQEES